MKTSLMMVILCSLSLSAKAQYQTFVKKVNWNISKEKVSSSRNSEFKKVVNIESASTMRLLFAETRLGRGNYLKIEFPFERKPLFMSDRIIKGFGNGSPYLKGGKFRLTLVLKNKRNFRNLKIKEIEATRLSNKRSPRTICEEDDRIASDEKKMGRMMRDLKGKGGCSGGMFSKTCLITAGHCLSTTAVVEFHVPASDKRGRPVPADPENQYAKTEVIESISNGPGDDWAVIRYGKNPLTGKYPGEAQGSYEVFAGELNKGDVLRITGYGTDSEKVKSQTQQTNSGDLTEFAEALRYRVDTTPGNSGTPVIYEATDTIVGVHTHGGCGDGSGSNKGTSVHFSPKFQAAIKACLAAEQKELRKQ